MKKIRITDKMVKAGSRTHLDCESFEPGYAFDEDREVVAVKIFLSMCQSSEAKLLQRMSIDRFPEQ